jgi:hypothetical protein
MQNPVFEGSNSVSIKATFLRKVAAGINPASSGKIPHFFQKEFLFLFFKNIF